MHQYPEIVVSLNDSQCLRFIDDINGRKNITDKVNEIQRKIRLIKKKPRTRETLMMVKELYRNLYELQFVQDYVAVVMDSAKDYDTANRGFTINGIKFRRFLGTSGGIKTSTIVYVNQDIYPELKKRLDNGRKMDIPMVPAKLEAYQALICSGSVPIPEPNGIIVVRDCITHFTDDIILINDNCEGEPAMTFEKNYQIDHDDSDGCGLMLPSYSRRVNGYLTGDGSTEISGMNTRTAWTKGMIYTFDFIEFAEKVAGTYYVTDVWGDVHDVRNAEVILTESMLKLWDCYDNWEDYEQNCKKNGYQFSTPKVTPDKLESVRDTNYQYLQSYNLTDNEIVELCKPTFNEINEVLGLDYRKTLVFLVGFSLKDNFRPEDFANYIQALMIEPEMINDSFILKKVWGMINKRMEMAKKGSIMVNGNFAMISGDPYALCQSMFGMEVTGILKAGEIYHRYWSDKGADEVVCFRSPMTCFNNIRKMKLCFSDDAKYWYRYIKTAVILNAWDTMCDALNGADKDGDTIMCTNNSVLLKNTTNAPTIICLQKKADKKVVTENDIIAANKLGFNDDIGTITNHITSMLERQAKFDKGSPEYEALKYRIMCGQHYQQSSIDRIKGVVAKPMPEYWYNIHNCKVKRGDTEDVIRQKVFNEKIVAHRKPYFMIYVYPQLRSKYKKYIKNNEFGAIRRFQQYGINSINDMKSYEPKIKSMSDYLDYYEDNMPTGNNACVVNRICWLSEQEFNTFSNHRSQIRPFDFSILKSNVGYSRRTFEKVEEVYQQYRLQMDNFKKLSRIEKMDSDYMVIKRNLFINTFKTDCEKICTNEDELCDIVIDLCYSKENTKQFAWDICGETIIKNLLIRNKNIISYPVEVSSEGEFTYCGRNFEIRQKKREWSD